MTSDFVLRSGPRAFDAVCASRISPRWRRLGLSGLPARAWRARPALGRNAPRHRVEARHPPGRRGQMAGRRPGSTRERATRRPRRARRSLPEPVSCVAASRRADPGAALLPAGKLARVGHLLLARFHRSGNWAEFLGPAASRGPARSSRVGQSPLNDPNRTGFPRSGSHWWARRSGLTPTRCKLVQVIAAEWVEGAGGGPARADTMAQCQRRSRPPSRLPPPPPRPSRPSHAGRCGATPTT